ncbi:restriction endonuclease [Streptomyces sp. NPDC088135]|uniref:restriction endonuclease n=1 Tax=unclassified Streptomyces TaxID=2593676 RepID=UPI0034459445
MSSQHTVLHDPDGIVESGLPLDRGPHECLAKAALAWTGAADLRPADLQQVALQLTGAARAVADDVRRTADLLPEDHRARALADIVLAEAERRLSLPLDGTVRCAQGRARLVRALYERLDRLAEIAPRPVRAP